MPRQGVLIFLPTFFAYILGLQSIVHVFQINQRLIHLLVKKKKTCTVFLSSYRNTSGSLGEREMLWEHKPQASVSTAFSSSPKLSRVFL